MKINFRVVLDISDRLAELLNRLIPKPKNTGEIKIMANYIVKDDNPDVGLQVTLGDVTDAEGNVISDAQVSVEIASTDDSVLAFAAGADDRSGSVHFGNPGQASLQYTVKGPNGEVLGSGSDGFTVTTGDPAAITGVSASFEGLTPVEEPTTTGGETGKGTETGTGEPTEGGV